MTDQKPGNPAVVGLAGFGTTTLLLQFHNLGMAGAGVLLWTALFFGGLAQLAAGLKEYETGNNFGFAAFSTYGAFWMALAGIYAGMHFGILTPSTTDIGWFLVAFTVPTIIYSPRTRCCSSLCSSASSGSGISLLRSNSYSVP